VIVEGRRDTTKAANAGAGPAALALAAALLLGGAPLSGGAEPVPARHRLFGDLALGGAASDNVYADRGQAGDSGFEIDLKTGLRSRFSPRTFSQIHYGLDTTQFLDATLENRVDHTLKGLVRHRLGDSLTIELRAGGRLTRFPEIDVFNSSTVSGQASARKYVAARTTLEGGLNLETKSYSQYDLDYGGVGFFAVLGHELGRRTSGEASLAFQRNGYSERRASEAGDLRSERNWLLGLRVHHDRSATLKLEGAYELAKLSSNGDFVDFGPFQSRFLDTIAGDERVIGDYYSHRRHELSVRARKLIRKGLYAALRARYIDRAYDGRLAKDANEEFLVPEQERHDHILQLSAILDAPLPVVGPRARWANLGVRLKLAHETASSNEALYDFSQNQVTLSLTSWF
jgi:hypothetical protein